ncbi:NAD(P)/FAD-dependent oxidoreductase [Acidovorax sp. 1608163]|uniref:NAD(P)/FAD-dependent oxidoreductase n=1 Tax=Acidovorax sp. 1608163 TaxID=2478662 RepID=UPI000EF6D095|nr:NAD(P)/FAD-dependent oxidoreductase [Acidovorax sp. 1608163]AYM96299.1 NAD(P)/FAD-dependent oxidoreductase [Acidovorax sp. 1608163]
MIQETDAVVIGAGPVGLFQVFQLGLQGLAAHIVDALPYAGGQCVELYGDKPIYDIPGVPVCTGHELAARLTDQIAPFKPQWHLGTQVAALQPQPDGRIAVTTQQGTQLLARAVFIAAGVGAFVPRALKVEGIEAFAGTQLFYQHLPPAATLQGQRLVVHGGDDAAVACAIAAATAAESPAASVVLLHRRDVFSAPPDQLAQLHALRDAGRIEVVVGQITGITRDTSINREGKRLTALQTLTPEGTELAVPMDVLVVALGVSPRLGPIADWGLAMERKQLVVDTATFRTSAPGIYAVGDIITYPGKRKLIVCGFHEATLAAFAAAEALSGKPVVLQYTTSSTHLHQLLGVGAAAIVNG